MTIVEAVKQAAEKKLFFMSRPERMITPQEVERVVMTGELVEDYPHDTRGHSCLFLGFGDANRAIHVVCSRKTDYLAVITAYLPDTEQWSSDYRRRR
jgi:hypothetical protein